MRQGHFQFEVKTHNRTSLAAHGHSSLAQAVLCKEGLLSATVLLPPGSPESLKNRSTFLNTIDTREPRKNAKLYREIILGLAHDQSLEDQFSCALEMGHYLVDQFRVGVDVAHYRPVLDDNFDPRNFRAHLVFTRREITPQGYHKTNKSIEVLDNRRTSGEAIRLMRKRWEEIENAMYERRGMDVRVDARPRRERLSGTHPDVTDNSGAVGQT